MGANASIGTPKALRERASAPSARSTIAAHGASPNGCPRVLVISPWWPTTPSAGFGSFVRDQARALLVAGVDVRVGVLRLVRGSTPGRWASEGDAAAIAPGRAPAVVRGPWVPYRAGYDVLLRIWTGLIRRAVLRQGAWMRDAVVLVHTQDLAVPARRALAPLGLPWVVVAHGLEPDSPRYVRRGRLRAYRAAMTAASRVVAVGPDLARHLRLECPGAAVRLVLNGYDRDLVRRIGKEPAATTSEPRIVSVSNLNEGKGIHLTLEALAMRSRGGHSVPRYEIVGDGPARAALEAQASRSGLSGLVRFRGALPHDEALRAVRGATAFVLPSSPEACGIAYLEAMALGTAPVAIRGEGPSGFIEDGVSGELVERTVAAVASAIDRLLDEPGVAARLGEGAARAAEGHDWSASVGRLLEVLPPGPAPRRPRPIPIWLSLYNEPTPYVTGKLDEIEAGGAVHLRRAWVSANASQAWGEDAPYRPQDLVDDVPSVVRAALGLLRGHYAGLHAGGWGGNWVTPFLLLAAWLGRRPLLIESDTHRARSEGFGAQARRVYLRFLDRRVRAWLPGGTPQAEHLMAAVAPRAPMLIEGMTTDTATLLAEAERLGGDAAPRFRRELGIGADALLVLYVGRIAPEKGVPDLVEATARLLAEGLDVCLVLLGPGTLDPAVVALLPPERLRAPGRTRWHALVPAYMAADVLALPSSFEPWGLVVNEALLFGCPVVVSDAVGAGRDLVEGPGTGVVVPVGSVQGLTDGLRTVLRRGGRGSELGARAAEVGRSWSRSRAAAVVQRSMTGRQGDRAGRAPC